MLNQFLYTAKMVNPVTVLGDSLVQIMLCRWRIKRNYYKKNSSKKKLLIT